MPIYLGFVKIVQNVTANDNKKHDCRQPSDIKKSQYRVYCEVKRL